MLVNDLFAQTANSINYLVAKYTTTSGKQVEQAIVSNEDVELYRFLRDNGGLLDDSQQLPDAFQQIEDNEFQ